MATIWKHDLERWASKSSENWTCSRGEVKSKLILLPFSGNVQHSVTIHEPCLKRQDKGVGAVGPEILELLVDGRQGGQSQVSKHVFTESPLQLGLLVCHTEDKRYLCSCVSGVLEKSKVQCPGLGT